jgi:hypothetical protein
MIEASPIIYKKVNDALYKEFEFVCRHC